MLLVLNSGIFAVPRRNAAAVAAQPLQWADVRCRRRRLQRRAIGSAAGGRPLQPPPDVNELLQRLATVLHEDGEELIADNILLQCRQPDQRGRELSTTSDAARRSAARSLHWIGAGIVAATPLPVWICEHRRSEWPDGVGIAAVYSVDMTKERARELAVSAGRTPAGLGIVKGG